MIHRITMPSNVYFGCINVAKNPASHNTCLNVMLDAVVLSSIVSAILCHISPATVVGSSLFMVSLNNGRQEPEISSFIEIHLHLLNHLQRNLSLYLIILGFLAPAPAPASTLLFDHFLIFCRPIINRSSLSSGFPTLFWLRSSLCLWQI